MKKIVRLTEGQLYRLIEQALMAEKCKRRLTESKESGLNFLSDATEQAHTNDQSELDEHFGSDPFYNNLSQKLKSKVKSGNLVVPVTYNDYYGTTCDKAVIEYFKENFPNNIVSIKTAYDGQFAYIFGDDAFIHSETSNAIYDYRPEMEREIAYQGAERIVNEYNLQLDRNELGELVDFLEEYGNIEPNYVDYSDSKLEEFLRDHGWLNTNESVAHRVTESIIRKLNENDVADIYHNDALSNIALTIENDEEIYRLMTWLKNALAKKVKNGIVPDRDYLADCSTVRKIAQMAVRKNAEFYKVQLEERPPYLSNAQKQEIRYHIADLIFDRLSNDGLI